MTGLPWLDELISLVLATLRSATPLIFAALGGFFSERSGTVQISLEGQMLMGALTGAVIALKTGNPYLGFICGGLAGVFVTLVFAVFSLKLRMDQIVLGTGLNILAMGLAPFVTKVFFDSTGSTPSLPAESRFTSEPMFLLFALIPLLLWWFAKTKSSLYVQFAGENPTILSSLGKSVLKIRLYSLMTCGLLAGFGGASLSLFLASAYSPNMTAGRGFIALAALIFGKWKPGPTIAACLFFAFIDSLQVQLQGSGLPVQFIQILPYLVTVVALAGFFGRSRAPAAIGKPLEESK
ncbi:MAG: ABC transporter permease [Proteobacteria bacterium]|nr:ABC transporter permease [Pseudomonadota bacterium]